MTPPKVVKDMLDLLDQKEFEKKDTYWFEPSCGDGEFLLEILNRGYIALREKYKGEPFFKEKALAETILKIKAIDIDFEMVIKARTRMYKEIFKIHVDEKMDVQEFLTFLVAQVLVDMIQCKDFFTQMAKYNFKDGTVEKRGKKKKIVYH